VVIAIDDGQESVEIELDDVVIDQREERVNDILLKKKEVFSTRMYSFVFSFVLLYILFGMHCRNVRGNERTTRDFRKKL
jgi:hypothetical protein